MNIDNVSKAGIQEFIAQYHRYIWLINIPFVVYFAISLSHIGKMKSDIEIIQKVLINQANNNVINSQKQYDKAELIAGKTKKINNFYQSIDYPLQSIQSSSFVNSGDWLGEVDRLENQFKEILGWEKSIFEFNQKELQWGNTYPAIRSYITSKYAIQMITILHSKLFSTNCSMYLCHWVDPLIQKYGNDLLLYPNVYNDCDPKYAEFWVNGVKLDQKKYLFKPKKKGFHDLEIEYKYLYQGHTAESISVKKELFVSGYP